MLQDSGGRQEFESGAVRDIAEGKGRCDLLPLDTIAEILSEWEWYWCDVGRAIDSPVLSSLYKYLKGGDDTRYLTDAFYRFVDCAFNSDIHGAIIELSKHYEDGAKKYNPNNWKLGIPLHCYIDSAIRHYLKWLRGDTDEPHDRAVLWNLVGAIWTHHNKPELNDIRHSEIKIGDTLITHIVGDDKGQRKITTLDADIEEAIPS